ncbi:BTAD domain-containing putative transcriptional regulator [Amorphoplanes nipponensis]|uniref:SARP family transcriptional regulator n=1 Tax=Actinoplanes nipponensis TaxID=135950 RepID=A0A919JHB0_9ACTN|nr:BTAD domain-containing putative transcriptional regulator [Actinoplanes nipponensis]GIE49062.1 SARP family transcriptional regulator [Actinoplanes nipponensis]
MSAEFRLLGEIELRSGGRAVDIGHTKQTYVLAALAVDAGRCVPPDSLVARVWGADPPRRARETTRAYLCRLRQALEPYDVVIIRQAAGYLLAVDPLAVDLHRFRHLVAAARAAAAPTAQQTYAAALGLWRGDPLGLLDTPWSAELRAELAREREAAERDHVDLLLAGGRHAELIGALTARAAAEPFDERLAGQLILALYRSDRRADALAHYDRVRRQLADELGIDPGPSLRQLHRQMLRADASLAAPRAGAAGHRAKPRQLPPLPAAFTGRAAVLSRLDAALRPGAAGKAAPVVVVHGPGGVGKTWLAVRWAHDNADRFADGQLHLNLRGFDPGRDPVPPEVAVRSLLYGLGVTAAAVPPDGDSQVALYRSLMAERQILLVLDNARTSAQVEPLLPGAASCATLITARSGLPDLVAGHSARPVPLATVDDAESAQVLAGHLGAARLTAEPAAVAELIRHCAGLPLALGIVAGRAALAPELPLSAFAEDLRESSARLDGLDGGGLRSNLRAVLAASLAAVRPAAADLFGRLGAAPGPDIALAAVRRLTGLARGELMPSLRELIDAHLVQEHQPGRYRMHDLVRLYAAELAGDPAPVRERMLDYYATTALAADHTLDLTRAGPGAGAADPVDAMVWFEQEHQVLLSCVAQAAGCGADRQVLVLVRAMTTYLERRGRWHDRTALQRAAIRAALRLGDPGAEADARRGLAVAQIWLGAYDAAAGELATARERFGAAGDRAGLAATHRTTARMYARQGRHADALEHDEQALALFRQEGHLAGQATALNAIGWHHAHLGRPATAIARCRQALALHERLGDRFGQGLTWDTLGAAYERTGDHAHAMAHFRLAVDAFRSCGDRFQEADTLRRLGAVLLGAGAVPDGCAAWRRAALILEDLGHPDAGEIRRDLGRVTTDPATAALAAVP